MEHCNQSYKQHRIKPHYSHVLMTTKHEIIHRFTLLIIFHWPILGWTCDSPPDPWYLSCRNKNKIRYSKQKNWPKRVKYNHIIP